MNEKCIVRFFYPEPRHLLRNSTAFVLSFVFFVIGTLCHNLAQAEPLSPSQVRRAFPECEFSSWRTWAMEQKRWREKISFYNNMLAIAADNVKNAPKTWNSDDFDLMLESEVNQIIENRITPKQWAQREFFMLEKQYQKPLALASFCLRCSYKRPTTHIDCL